MADKILNDTDRRNINAALSQLNGTIPMLDLLDKLGVDTGDMRAAADEYRRQLTAAKEFAFPGQP